MLGETESAHVAHTVNPAISVVVAVEGNGADIPGRDSLETCLAALESQAGDDAEVLAIVSSRPGTGLGALRERFPRVLWFEVSDAEVSEAENRGSEGTGASLVPHLWARGIGCARGDLVAVTTSRFVPGSDWLLRMAEAFERGAGQDQVAAVGGVILPPESGGSADWAVFLLRYSATLGVREELRVDDVSADNACYRRDCFDYHPNCLEDGFWEPELHRELRAAGRELRLVPSLRVRFASSPPPLRFCIERFRHGRRYGTDRLAGRPALAALATAAGVLVPFVLGLRIARRAALHHPWRLLQSSPYLIVFLLAWSLGEMSGYLGAALGTGSAGGRP